MLLVLPLIGRKFTRLTRLREEHLAQGLKAIICVR